MNTLEVHMDGYACVCGWFGTEPTIGRSYEPCEFWGDTTPVYAVYKTCPNCDHDELLEVAICEGCEEQEAEPGHDDCRRCLAEQAEIEAEFKRDQCAETKALVRGAE